MGLSFAAPLAGRDGIAPVGPLVVVDFNPRTRDLIPLPSEKQPVGHLASRLFDHDGSHCIRDEGGKPTISLIQEKLYNEIARKRRLYVVMCSTVSQRKTKTPLRGTACIDYRNLQKIGLPKRKTEQRSFQNMKATGIVRRIDD